MLILFVALIAGPLVARTYFDLPNDGTIPMQLLQPTGQDNNDTLKSETGTAVSGGDPTSSGSSDSKLRLF